MFFFLANAFLKKINLLLLLSRLVSCRNRILRRDHVNEPKVCREVRESRIKKHSKSYATIFLTYNAILLTIPIINYMILKNKEKSFRYKLERLVDSVDEMKYFYMPFLFTDYLAMEKFLNEKVQEGYELLEITRLGMGSFIPLSENRKNLTYHVEIKGEGKIFSLYNDTSDAHIVSHSEKGWLYVTTFQKMDIYKSEVTKEHPLDITEEQNQFYTKGLRKELVQNLFCSLVLGCFFYRYGFTFQPISLFIFWYMFLMTGLIFDILYSIFVVKKGCLIQRGIRSAQIRGFIVLVFDKLCVLLGTTGYGIALLLSTDWMYGLFLLLLAFLLMIHLVNTYKLWTNKKLQRDR